MRRFKAGDISAVEGLWMTNEEAMLVKQELLARGTSMAKRLAEAMTFPRREKWAAGSSFDEDAEDDLSRKANETPPSTGIRSHATGSLRQRQTPARFGRSAKPKSVNS